MFARSIIKELIFGKKAVVVVLSGDLGAGKTTFAQGFAKGLSVKKPVKSPTFVILKRYHLQNVRCQMFPVFLSHRLLSFKKCPRRARARIRGNFKKSGQSGIDRMAGKN